MDQTGKCGMPKNCNSTGGNDGKQLEFGVITFSDKARSSYNPTGQRRWVCHTGNHCEVCDTPALCQTSETCVLAALWHILIILIIIICISGCIHIIWLLLFVYLFWLFCILYKNTQTMICVCMCISKYPSGPAPIIRFLKPICVVAQDLHLNGPVRWLPVKTHTYSDSEWPKGLTIVIEA